ncbi:MAG: hypothetical protein FWD27_03250 [Coriobacteriia bacterium]|nr:hypothetical protein [Coriobacteriia bacterium]
MEKKNNNTIIWVIAGVLCVGALLLFVTANTGGGGGGGVSGGAGTPGEGANMTSTENNNTSSDGTPIDWVNYGDEPLPEEFAPGAFGDPIDAETSLDVPTVTEVRKGLENRGLEDLPLTVDFAIDGTYSLPVELNSDSNDKYPSYTIDYLSSSDITWVIYVNNGYYLARPLVEIDTATPIVLSESDYIVGYNGDDNTFVTSNPPADQMIVVKVDRIDKATLDGYTLDELEKVWGAQ